MPMMEWIILVLIALAGFLGEPWWFMLLGALGLSLDTLIAYYQMLRNLPKAQGQWRLPAASVASAAACAVASYVLGWMLDSFVF